jgi:hypothetical protein
MSTPTDALKQITLHVQEQTSTHYQVRLTIDEQLAKGTLAVLTPVGEVSQHFEMTQVKKGKNGTQLTCIIRGATTTLTLEGDKNPPKLRVVATLLLPIFNATYHLSQAEHQRLVQWVNTLAIGALA